MEDVACTSCPPINTSSPHTACLRLVRLYTIFYLDASCHWVEINACLTYLVFGYIALQHSLLLAQLCTFLLTVGNTSSHNRCKWHVYVYMPLTSKLYSAKLYSVLYRTKPLLCRGGKTFVLSIIYAFLYLAELHTHTVMHISVLVCMWKDPLLSPLTLRKAEFGNTHPHLQPPTSTPRPKHVCMCMLYTVNTLARPLSLCTYRDRLHICSTSTHTT